MNFATTAHMLPTTIPPNISVGKCTKRYILLKPISDANTRAATPAFLLHINIDTAAAKEAPVCPDGKEEPDAHLYRAAAAERPQSAAPWTAASGSVPAGYWGKCR